MWGEKECQLTLRLWRSYTWISQSVLAVAIHLPSSLVHSRCTGCLDPRHHTQGRFIYWRTEGYRRVGGPYLNQTCHLQFYISLNCFCSASLGPPSQIQYRRWLKTIFFLVFRAFSRYFCPKWLTISRFVTSKKPQYRINKEKRKRQKKMESS